MGRSQRDDIEDEKSATLQYTRQYAPRNTLYLLKICVIRENYEHKDEKQNEKLCAFVSSCLRG
jgi:hypothetical protein